ncbi:MAG: hypothetical protein AAB731_00880, partial [Patescibacteria group bacterium]
MSQEKSFFEKLSGFFAWSLPRGRIRIYILIFIVVFLAAGAFDYPAFFNKAADKVNGLFARVAYLNEIKIPHLKGLPYRLGLDLQGGTHLVYEADTANIQSKDRADAVEGVRDVIERRVNAFGVSEPLVQTNYSAGTPRIIIDLAGVKDVSEAIKQIGETPILEFKEQSDKPLRSLTADEKKQMDEYDAKAKTTADGLLSQVL